jgi:hypothetical protein
MRLLAPLWLLALLAVPVVLLVDARRPWTGGRVGGVTVRGIVLVLLTLAAAQPVLDRPTGRVATLRVVDRSASAPEQAPGEGTTVDFAASAGFAGPDLDREGTDLDAALMLALARLPADRPGRITVATDGGGAATSATLDRARDAGVAVDVDPLEAIDAPRLVALALDAPRASRGATVTGALRVHGGRAGLSGPATVSLGDRPVATVDVGVDAGDFDSLPFTFAVPTDADAGLARLTATLAEDRVSTALVIARPPRVLLVGGDPRAGEAVAGALTADGLEVTRVAPAAAPTDLSDRDLVVLADAPAGGPGAKGRGALPSAFLAALDPWVRDGGGLLVLGGPHAYELGGYPTSALDPLLPVTAEPPGQERELNVEMVIALDKSSSMAAPVTGGAVARSVAQRLTGGRAEGSKITLVAGAAAASIRRLRDADRIGVLAVDSEARWMVEPTSAAARGDIAKRVGRLSAGGGGIFLTDALVAAREPLLESDAAVRHLLLFADTADVSQKEGTGPDGAATTAAALVTELAENGVTISIIGIGERSDRDVAYLADLARQSGGRFRLTSDFRRLKALFVQETEQVVARSLEEDETARVRVARSHPALAGLPLDAAPPLQGWNRLEARPRARTLVETTTGAPVFVAWNVGLGEVVTVATDSGERWAAGWPRWPGSGPLWTRLARSLARDPDAAGTALDIAVDGWDVTLTHRSPEGLTPPSVGLTTTLDRADGVVDLPLTLVAPGRWTTRLDAAPESRWTLTATRGDGTLLARREGIAPASPEREPVDPSRLDALRIPAGDPPTHLRTVPLGPWLLLLGILLLPADAWVRRGARAA